MKRSLFVLAILVLSFGLSFATMDFTVEFVGSTYVDGNTSNTYYDPGQPMSIKFLMNNNGDAYQGYSFFVEFTGDVDITWADVAANDYGIYYNPDQSTWFGLVFFKNYYSFDGALPDSFNHTTGGISGMPGAAADVLMYEFFFNVATPLTYADGERNICVDSINGETASYDWIMATNAVFAGPHCFPVPIRKPDNFAPEFTDCPTVTHTMQWDEIYNLTLNLTDADSDPVTSASLTDDAGGLASVTGFTANTVSVSFDPATCGVGSFSFTVGATDDAHSIPTGNECTINVDVLNTAPEFVDCPTDVPVIGITAVLDAFDLDATDANTGDDLVFSFPTPMAGVTIDANTGVITVDGSAFVGDEGIKAITARVTDCHGDFEECTVSFEIVSETMFEIKISKEHDVYQGHHRMVSVTKEEGSNKMYGFDFVIAYDASALSFMKALQGDGIADWEMFTYRFGATGNCGNACPSGLLEVVAMYDENDGPNHPTSDGQVDNGDVLFTLDFYVSNNRLYECQFVPIKFFWTQCSDNTIAYHPAAIADPLHIETAVSKTVWAYQGPGYYEITDDHFQWGPNAEDWGFPTYTGIQEGCDHEPLEEKSPIPFIHFYGGGVDIICADDIDARGDVNLNGIDNEIADAVVFTNYFIYGLAAFTVNVEGQTAATDINADGIVLSVADLVYLIRVIVGDALPYDKLSPYASSADFGTANGMITTEAELGAGLFVFEGDVNVSLAEGANNMEILTAFDGTNTRALVYSLDAGATFSGNLLHADGDLVSAEAADYFGNAYKVDVLPTTFGLSNYPNPFNPSTTIMMELPTATDWTLEVFNTLGQKVFTTNGYGAGVIPVVWDATDQASGIYFYKVSTSSEKMTKKMVLMK
jgi:hypothetical protein